MLTTAEIKKNCEQRARGAPRPKVIVGRLLDLCALQLCPDAIAAGRRLDAGLAERATEFHNVPTNIEQLVAQWALQGRISLCLRQGAFFRNDRQDQRLNKLLERPTPVAGVADTIKSIKQSTLSPNELTSLLSNMIGHDNAAFRHFDGWIKPGRDCIVTVFPHTDYQRRLAELCDWISASPPLPVSIQAIVSYLQLCHLHAFVDGNGRLGRELCNCILSARLLSAPQGSLALGPVLYSNMADLTLEFRRFYLGGRLDSLVFYLLALLKKAADAALQIAASDPVRCPDNLATTTSEERD